MRITPIRMNYLNPVSFRNNEIKTAENETMRFVKTKDYNRIVFREEKEGISTYCEIIAPKRMCDYGNIYYEVSHNTPFEAEDRETLATWGFRSICPGVTVTGADKKEDLKGLIDAIKHITKSYYFKEQLKNDWSSEALCAQLDAVTFNLEKQAQKKN